MLIIRMYSSYESVVEQQAVTSSTFLPIGHIMNKQTCLAFLYALFFFIPYTSATQNAAHLARIQLSEPDTPKVNKSLKKIERAQFEHAYTLKKADIALFEQSFCHAPLKLKAIVNEMLQGTETAAKFKTLLLAGPSGSGKTTLAQAIAHKLGRSCEVVHAPTLLGHFRDQAAEEVKYLFKRIAKDPKKPVLVLDEMNALTDDHTSEHSDTKHTAMQLWTRLDKYTKKKNFLLIGTTNVTQKMPHQLQTRFQGKTFVIDHPSHESCKEALQLHLKTTPIDESCNETYLNELSKKMTDFSQRAIEVLTDNAVILAGIDSSDLSKRVLSKKHLEQAYKDLVSENDKLWDFKEHTTNDERRHRENKALSEKHFKEGQENQIRIAEWTMIFQAIMRDRETNRIHLDKGMEAINESKKMAFPDKKPVAKVQILQEPGIVVPGKYAVLPNTDENKQKSSIQMIPVRVNNESK